MKLLSLILLLTTLALGDDLFFTKGEANGAFWRDLTDPMKISLLVGTGVGRGVLSLYTLSDLPVCNNRVDDDPKWPIITNANLSKELDTFYNDAANMPLPISIAVIHIFMKLRGATKEDLEKFRAASLKAYLK